MADLLEQLRAALGDRYDVEAEVGHGGMAVVFRAHDLKLHRLVAIKVLRPELAACLGGDRFVREIDIAARLTHPNILALHDCGEADGLLYYVMPFIEGESLRDRLAGQVQLSFEEALQITAEVADALAYAHASGIVHRDIKPENILFESGHAIVADFGVARALAAGGQSLTETGIAVGTPAYMSPEQAAGDNHIDARSDIYSLGCVLYEMLTGTSPFTGANPQAVMARHSVDNVSPPHIVRPSIPPELEAIVLCALAKSPADRFQSAAAFAETSRAVAAGRAPRLPRSAVSVSRASAAWRRRRRLLLAGLAVIAVSALAIMAGRYLPRHPTVVTSNGLDPRRIVVRYFDDLSRGKTLGPLADGLTEALIARLGEVRALDVVSKNGVAPYRGSGASRDSIARALTAGSLIEGTVEDVGQRVRVTVRLVDGASGADVERASFERPPSDVLRMQDQLGEQIATFLRRRLGEEVRLRGQQAGTASVDAWLLVQQAERARKDADSLGRAGDLRGGEGALARADSLLARAEAADPAWIEPVMLRAAVAYRRSRPPFYTEPLNASPWIAVGLGHAGRALMREPDHPRALELRGTLRYWSWLLHLSPDPRQAAALLRDAEQDLRAAVRLDPSLASDWSVLSHLDYQKSDLVQAKLDAQRGYEADAYYAAADVMWRLYLASYDLEQFADAVHWCEEGAKRFPGTARFVKCRLWLLTTRAEPPNVGSAWRLLGELERLTPAPEWAYEKLESQITVAGVLARAGFADSARRLLARSRAGSDLDPTGDLRYYEAFVRTLLGERDDALRLLKEYVATNPERRADLAKDYQWWFRDLRSDPRYRELAGIADR